jgi:hypothetical protein
MKPCECAQGAAERVGQTQWPHQRRGVAWGLAVFKAREVARGQGVGRRCAREVSPVLRGAMRATRALQAQPQPHCLVLGLRMANTIRNPSCGLAEMIVVLLDRR